MNFSWSNGQLFPDPLELIKLRAPWISRGVTRGVCGGVEGKMGAKLQKFLDFPQNKFLGWGTICMDNLSWGGSKTHKFWPISKLHFFSFSIFPLSHNFSLIIFWKPEAVRLHTLWTLLCSYVYCLFIPFPISSLLFFSPFFYFVPFQSFAFSYFFCSPSSSPFSFPFFAPLPVFVCLAKFAPSCGFLSCSLHSLSYLICCFVKCQIVAFLPSFPCCLSSITITMACPRTFPPLTSMKWETAKL